MWGYAASPVIYKDRVIQNCAPGDKCFLAAFDLATGRDLWRIDEPASSKGGTRGTWTTPIVVNLAGEDQLVCFQPSRVVSYRPADGEIVWFCKTENRKGDLAYSSPIISDGMCVALGGYSGGGKAFKLGGSGDITEGSELWYKPTNPQSIGTGVIIDGYVYIPDAGPGTIRCLEVKTGEEKWQDRQAGTNWGSIVHGRRQGVRHQPVRRHHRVQAQSGEVRADRQERSWRALQRHPRHFQRPDFHPHVPAPVLHCGEIAGAIEGFAGSSQATRNPSR